MDEFMVQLLQEKNRKALSENQNHNDVMGPLEKLWHALEQANKENQSSKYSIGDLLRLVQQTVLLVGKTNVTLFFHRRLNAPYYTMSSSP